MFHEWPSTKIAQTILLHWTKWPLELNTYRKIFKRLLLNRWMNFEIITQECSLGDPLPNCSNYSTLLNKMVTWAKNRKTFKQLLLLNSWTDFEIISQKCSLGHCLPKLLKPSTPPYITYHFICTMWIRWAIQGHHGPLVSYAVLVHEFYISDGKNKVSKLYCDQ